MLLVIGIPLAFFIIQYLVGITKKEKK